MRADLATMRTVRLKERFWSKVALPDANGCMEWLAAKDNNGYGRFAVYDTTTRLAHHVAIFLMEGRDPRGSVVMHTCDNPPCVAPGHLRVGTYRDNCLDKMRKGRYRRGPKKLTDEQVLAIREAIRNNVNYKVIAAEHGISSLSTITNIKHGRRLTEAERLESRNW